VPGAELVDLRADIEAFAMSHVCAESAFGDRTTRPSSSRYSRSVTTGRDRGGRPGANRRRRIPVANNLISKLVDF